MFYNKENDAKIWIGLPYLRFFIYLLLRQKKCEEKKKFNVDNGYDLIWFYLIWVKGEIGER